PIVPAEVARPDDLALPRVRARDAHSGGNRLRSALQEADLFGTGNDVAQPVRDVDFARVRQPGHVAERGGVEDRARGCVVGVAYSDASERHRAVDQRVAAGGRYVAP